MLFCQNVVNELENPPVADEPEDSPVKQLHGAVSDIQSQIQNLGKNLTDQRLHEHA